MTGLSNFDTMASPGLGFVNAGDGGSMDVNASPYANELVLKALVEVERKSGSSTAIPDFHREQVHLMEEDHLRSSNTTNGEYNDTSMAVCLVLLLQS
jgi:hypothetical protein